MTRESPTTRSHRRCSYRRTRIARGFFDVDERDNDAQTCNPVDPGAPWAELLRIGKELQGESYPDDSSRLVEYATEHHRRLDRLRGHALASHAPAGGREESGSKLRGRNMDRPGPGVSPILLYDGASWTLLPSGTTAQLNSVRGGRDGRIFIGGNGGTLLELAWP